ncbi:DUF2384 domain-containing protein [Luteibacter pinisoli]|uniref:DUF2384 domain-containing protein n=1 Tax=Luteibacter pinisoli TaxID=2589080 RepID=A0A4Y5Z5I7_9GAMM|nr:antitoxin Xre/MbcA/ParS toxin-binding domain-containing protein [Luteibacter pinisoli]QDE39829.1 DUF2384 domain-containing protein [Luteibacter pinisoli]
MDVKVKNSAFAALAGHLERLRVERQHLIDDAFSSLCARRALLAGMLIEEFGSPARAAIWVTSHQRVFGGRTPLEVLAEGDDDLVWDALGRDGAGHAHI